MCFVCLPGVLAKLAGPACLMVFDQPFCTSLRKLYFAELIVTVVKTSIYCSDE